MKVESSTIATSRTQQLVAKAIERPVPGDLITPFLGICPNEIIQQKQKGYTHEAIYHICICMRVCVCIKKNT